MYRLLTVFLFSIIFLFGANQKILSVEEAFDVKFEKKENSLNIDLILGEKIYLYQKSIKVKILKNGEKIDITKDIKQPKTTSYQDENVFFDKLGLNINNKLLDKADKIILSYQGCSKAGLCYQPLEADYILNPALTQTSNDETDNITDSLKTGNFWLVLLTFFGFGLLLSLTPCIFPMIPILSSIIVSHSENEKMSSKRGLYLSFVYVLFMSLAYTIAGVIAGLFGANIQTALQNPYVLVGFSAVFVALAFSMFGYYELSLPSSWQTKIDKISQNQSDKKGVAGVAIMGFLSALIVGPCVAPPLAGALVYIGQTGDALLGGLTLFVLSFGMGVPLLLIGFGAGKYMPKPGGWMDLVSKIFGVVMLLLAVWILDRILPSFVSFILFGSIGLFAGIYFISRKNIFIQVVAVVFLLFSLISFVGVYNNSNNILNPFKSAASHSNLNFQRVKTIDELLGVVAQEKDSIVMVDFTASWCIGCQELEEWTFSDKSVQDRLHEFVLLQVDTTHNTDQDKDILKHFGLFGPPVILFFKDGKLLPNKIVGYKNPKEFIGVLDTNGI
ncbi:MAG: thiol:disulfide interchange protein [Epsilonproteobacteria bacterium]|nr:MAG: thiol:disulfide interchange protein [Campylobacterota bacterium]